MGKSVFKWVIKKGEFPSLMLLYIYWYVVVIALLSIYLLLYYVNYIVKYNSLLVSEVQYTRDCLFLILLSTYDLVINWRTGM